MGQESEALKSDIAERRDSMSETIDAIGDRVVPGRIVERRRAAVRDWAGGVRGRVMGTAQNTKDHVGSATDLVGEGMSQVTDKVGDAPAQVQQATAGSPLIAGAVAFGIGALIAAFLPQTDPERKAVRAVQPQVEAATDAVKDVGQQALATAKESAQDATEDLKASVADHAQEVAGQAKEAGQQIKEAAT